MKNIATKVLYLFSFSLLFIALFLNFFHKEKAGESFQKAEKKVSLSTASLKENNAVVQPENNTVLK